MISLEKILFKQIEPLIMLIISFVHCSRIHIFHNSIIIPKSIEISFDCYHRFFYLAIFFLFFILLPFVLSISSQFNCTRWWWYTIYESNWSIIIIIRIRIIIIIVSINNESKSNNKWNEYTTNTTMVSNG